MNRLGILIISATLSLNLSAYDILSGLTVHESDLYPNTNSIFCNDLLEGGKLKVIPIEPPSDQGYRYPLVAACPSLNSYTDEGGEKHGLDAIYKFDNDGSQVTLAYYETHHHNLVETYYLQVDEKNCSTKEIMGKRDGVPVLAYLGTTNFYVYETICRRVGKPEGDKFIHCKSLFSLNDLEKKFPFNDEVCVFIEKI